MAKFGRLTANKWGHLMPCQNPLAPPPPYYYRETEALVFTYHTDEDIALDLLPEELELVEPATAFTVIETNHKCTIGPYSEIYTAILCQWQGELVGFCNAVYVTEEASQILGREIWGFGKKQADRIELIKHGSGVVEAVLEVTAGNRSITVLAQPTIREPAEAVASMPLVCLKVIPDAAGGTKPALAQLVSVLFESKPHIGSDGNAEVYSGGAEVIYDMPSDANLPVNELVSCQYSTFYADLPYGKVLKTY